MHPIEKSPHAELASSCLRSGVLGVRAAEMSIDAVEGYSREPIPQAVESRRHSP